MLKTIDLWWSQTSLLKGRSVDSEEKVEVREITSNRQTSVSKCFQANWMDLAFFHRFGDDNPAFGCWGEQASNWMALHTGNPNVGIRSLTEKSEHLVLVLDWSTLYEMWRRLTTTYNHPKILMQDRHFWHLTLHRRIAAQEWTREAAWTALKRCEGAQLQCELHHSHEGYWQEPDCLPETKLLMTTYYKMQTVVLHKMWILERFGHRGLRLRLTLIKMKPLRPLWHTHTHTHYY